MTAAARRGRRWWVLLHLVASVRAIAQVDTDAKFTVSAIVVEGNRRTSTLAIVRQLDFRVGAVVDDQQLLKNTKKLESSGVLWYARMTTAPDPTAPEGADVRVVTIQVKERWTLYPNIPSVGFDSRKGWGVQGIGFSESNFLGRLWPLSAQVDWTPSWEFGVSSYLGLSNLADGLGISAMGGYSDIRVDPILTPLPMTTAERTKNGGGNLLVSFNGSHVLGPLGYMGSFLGNISQVDGTTDDSTIVFSGSRTRVEGTLGISHRVSEHFEYGVTPSAWSVANHVTLDLEGRNLPEEEMGIKLETAMKAQLGPLILATEPLVAYVSRTAQTGSAGYQVGISDLPDGLSLTFPLLPTLLFDRTRLTAEHQEGFKLQTGVQFRPRFSGKGVETPLGVNASGSAYGTLVRLVHGSLTLSASWSNTEYMVHTEFMSTAPVPTSYELVAEGELRVEIIAFHDVKFFGDCGLGLAAEMTVEYASTVLWGGCLEVGIVAKGILWNPKVRLTCDLVALLQGPSDPWSPFRFEVLIL